MSKISMLIYQVVYSRYIRFPTSLIKVEIFKCSRNVFTHPSKDLNICIAFSERC